MEALDRRRHNLRAALVGTPFIGTDMAEPSQLRNSIDLLTNLGYCAITNSRDFTLIPFFTAAIGLLKVLDSLAPSSVGAASIDSAVAAVPGINAMSKESRNAELTRLNVKDANIELRPYGIVSSSFKPKDDEWNFWTVFADSKRKGGAAGNSQLIFDEDNDLMVNTRSMFGADPNASVNEARCEFEGCTAHHTNYFRQSKTLSFLTTFLSASE